MYNNSGNCKGMVYVVKEGDTLYKIARDHDLKLIDVLKANPYVNVYNLQIGDELCLPTFPNRGFSIPGSVPEMYVQNDNMNSNVPRRDAEGNNMDRNSQEWNAPFRDAQGDVIDRNDQENDMDRDDRNRNDQDWNHQDGNDQNMQIYEIREGDTLADLLNYFQTDYDDLLTWNPGLRDLPIPLGVVVRYPQS